MKLSIIIPAYNCAQYLPSCIQQIVKAGLPDFEVILVDDGSTDNSADICDELSNQYARVRCMHQRNQGASAARNRGLEMAKGDYVLFLDADDTIEPERLSKLVRKLEAEPDVDMAIFGLSFDYYYRGIQYRSDELPPALSGKCKAEEWIGALWSLFLSNSLSPIWNKVIRRSIITEQRLQLCKEMFLYEDLEFSLRCMAHCDAICFWPDIIYHYRQTEDEGNAGRRLKRIDSLPELVGKIELALSELMNRKSASGEYKDQINSILLSLYLTLAREKVSVSDAAEIRRICDDFITWFSAREMQVPTEQRDFVEHLLNKQVNRLIARRTYGAIRHRIAVTVKNTWFYQRWKG